ncbi:hypothetical protein IFR04_004105 [Cadophora malorum]|uniref:Uncharacterized protein n=1 Tax=Cadophora malorum TaxID=108018 RepID=A0A8H7WDG3_9HELO|nr:hypothetical protein IFR04_004105 [Cadophora malorum]
MIPPPPKQPTTAAAATTSPAAQEPTMIPSPWRLQRESSLSARLHEDYCQQCTDDFSSGKRHIDIWTGSSTVNGGNEQIDCENKLTPSGNIVIVRDPANNYAVDTAPLYHKGTTNPCRTNHVYPDAKAHSYCG